jgi:ABC-type branched-subunit amino acid transport system substrate-binding protein
MKRFASLVVAALTLGPASAYGQQTYKIGASLGLSGYIASIDGPWKDGAALAIESVNKAGGVLGKKLELVPEDMRSEPAEAVTVARKLINSDKVIAMVNGCSSAGNAAMAPLVARAGVPMMLCSILPPKKEDQKWAFAYIPPPVFDVEIRLAHLKKVGTTKAGLVYDASPYAGMQKKVFEELAPKYGVTIVGAEQNKTTDADMTAYITKLHAAGADVIVKLGSGSDTITAAKAIKQLGLPLALVASTVDMHLVKESADALGTKFLFPAQRTQILALLPKDDPGLKATQEFMALWTAKYGDRDPTWAARGWDAVQTIVAAIRKANTAEGAKVRDAIENNLSLSGASGDLTFTADQHLGVRTNPYVLATMTDGKIVLVK